MNRYLSLMEKLENRKKVCGTCFALVSDPLVIEKMDAPALDFAVFDMEHGRYDAQNIVPILHTCRTLGLPSVVRVQDALYHLIAKPLDMARTGSCCPGRKRSNS
jgi:2-keto-3-deoxy-L-rhamnonate aldolase RhmA